jgi:putative intracellular protease/amidase
MPHASLSYMGPEDFDLLLLVGGNDQWEKGDNLEVFPLILATVGKRPVAAVGSAILALADLGLLDHTPHTGEGPEYFQQYCPDYAGEEFFCAQPCVVADDIITIDSGAIADPGVFDTLQEIYSDDHELFDPAAYAKRP